MALRFKEHKIQKTFTFILSEKEIVAKTKDLGTIYKQLGAKEVEFANIKRKFTKEIDGLMAARDKIIQVNDLGKEDREVECVMRLDYENKIVEYIVKGEILESRPMSESEKQASLFDQQQTKIKQRDAAKAKSDSEITGSKKARDPETKAQSKGRQMNDDIKQAIREETNRKTKKDMVI